jgi:microsomal epoxide hydrolase
MRHKWNHLAIATLVVDLLVVTASAQRSRKIEDGLFTTSDGTRIHFLHEGEQARLPSLVFIPGWTLSATLWTEQLHRFSEHRLVVAVDPRSQAESSQSPLDNTPEGRARDLHDLVVHLGIKQFVIVGWSQGAQDVAAYITEFGTAQLAGLVFVDSPVSAGPEEITLHPEFSKAVLSGLAIYANHPAEYYAGLVHSIFATPHPELDISTLIAESEKTPSAVGTQMLTMDIFRVDRRPALKKIDKPTLVIAASTSPLLQAQEEMAAAIPSARFVTVEGAGHAVFVDDPEQFDQALIKLLAGI